MNTHHLIDAVSVYLRQLRRLKQAGFDAALPDAAEAAIWDYAQQAAERLERQREKVPVPVKRRRSDFRP